MLEVRYETGRDKADDSVRIEVPLSKSMAARSLILNYIRGEEEPLKMPDCDDTRELSAAIARLRRYIPSLPDYMCDINSADGKYCDIYIKEGFDMGNGGTSLRFFLALVASIPGVRTEIRCSGQLKSRPLAPLIDVLRKFGAEIDCTECEGYAPLIVKGNILTGGRADISKRITSQYFSALILVQSLWRDGLIYDTEGLVSKPYVFMTESMADHSGVSEIEYDWSAAANFYEIALVTGCQNIEIGGLIRPEDSLQGDSRCVELFGKLGVNTIFRKGGGVCITVDTDRICKIRDSKSLVSVDMEQNPDLVPPIAVGMALAGIRFKLMNVDTLKYKESDRLGALIGGLAKFGLKLTDKGGSLIFDGGEGDFREVEMIDCCQDHRIAMAMAAVAAKSEAVVVDENCVTKSFPDFFKQIHKLGFVSCNMT